MRIQNKFVDEYNKMRPEVRRKTHFVGSPARRGRRTVQGEWSREELITWARTNNIRHKTQLWRWTADPAHKSDPSVYLIRKTFGSWGKFVKEAFGVQPPIKKQWPDDICRYIQNTIIIFHIETATQYKELVKRRPDIFPSFFFLKKAFKRWRDAYLSAQQSDANGTYNAYVKLRKELGRWPTLAECHKNKIDLSDFLIVYGNKEGFDEFVANMESRL